MEENRNPEHEAEKPEREILNDPKLCILILQMAVTALLLLGMFGLRLSGSKLYTQARTVYYKLANDITAVEEVLGEDKDTDTKDGDDSDSSAESQTASAIESEPDDLKESEILDENTSQPDAAVQNTAATTVFDLKAVQTSLNTGVSKTQQMIWPLKSYKKSSAYGYRSDPFTGAKAFHYGVDLAAAKSTPIAAVLDGTVSAIGEGKSYGNYIMVRHNSNLTTLYAHCSKIVAKKGQKLKQGDTVALVGSTGRSTGNHLHFEIRIGGKRVDPLWLLP